MMNKAKEGIIYFSFGGQFRTADLPKEKLDIFIKIFSELRFKDIVILWKFETVDLKDRHDYNFVIGPWLPQQEILSHKNLRAFITHGGLLSLMEAINYGKPIIGIPILSSHKYNMAQAEREGFGITVDYETINEDTVRRAIDAIFNDTSYRENAERMSEHLKDHQITQIDKAVWYVEHVIRTNGANYLRTAATKLSFWEMYLIDQILCASMLVATMIFALSNAVKWTRMKFQKRYKSTHKAQRSLAAAAAASSRKKLKSN
jgi:glucuronosyltransferase